MIRALSLTLLLFSASAWAAPAAAPPAPPDAPSAATPAPPPAPGSSRPGNTNVLNFEADVIEGEKKGADLLLETETTHLELDAVLYQRENFNDFHASDSKRRPRLAVPPSAPAQAPRR